MVFRKLKRLLSAKRLFCVTVCCTVFLYLVSVVTRSQKVELAPGSRDVWTIQGFSNITDGACGIDCPLEQLPFYVRTGRENKAGPVICYRHKVIMNDDKKNVGRGINMVVIDDKTFDVVAAKNYDTYLEDDEFLRDMRNLVKAGNLVIMASFDEVSESLKADGRKWIKLLGAQQIDQVTFRDAYILIGQKGLKQGHGIEFLERRGSVLYAPTMEKIGCISVPMGPVLPVEDALPLIVTAGPIQQGEPLDNCDVKSQCPSNHFPVMVDSGKESSEFPRVCVSGKIVMAKTINDAGRGMNFVVVNPVTGEAKHAIRFDTYDKDSNNMEIFLEGLSHDDIIIAVIFDDASRKLSFHGKELLNQLGSSMVQNLRFRDVWYFVGQKGIDGFTTMENISYAGMDAEWPKPIKTSFCMPAKVKGLKIVPDPMIHRNDEKRLFCKKYDGYGDFCDVYHVDEAMIKPVLLVDEALQKSPVYSSPIFIVPGMNNNALVKTLSTTVMQPGVDLQYVMVVWDEKFPEYGELANLFGVRNISVRSSTSYKDQMVKSIEKAATFYKNSKYMIVLEEELLLSPDFLYFLSQTIPALDADQSLLGVTAFNYNGFEDVSGNSSRVYRVHEFPGLGFMLKMSVYQQRIRGSLKSCCLNRAWVGWQLPLYNYSHSGDMLVPDVSRVYRQPYQGSRTDDTYLTDLLNRRRITNVDRKVRLTEVDKLISPAYDRHLDSLLKTAVVIHIDMLQQCGQVKDKMKFSLSIKSRPYVAYYKQSKEGDYTNLSTLCQCFGMFYTKHNKPKNTYKDVLRFSYLGIDILLVGSRSPFFVHNSRPLRVFEAT